MITDKTAETRADADNAAHDGVKSVDRAIPVLETLTLRGDPGVEEIAEEMGLHKSTASRLHNALDARDLDVDRCVI